MDVTASILIPTRARPGYLDVALRSIAPQAGSAGAEIVVVDDGPDDATRAAALRHGARYVAHERSRGPNAARNTAIDAARAALLVFVDDDVAVRPGWLAALLDADARAPADVGVLTGPIHARFEDHPLRSCGRELPPITTQDHGPEDRDVGYAWGANMTLRRSALERAGRFDESRELYGDEQEWLLRFVAGGGRIRYVAAAALDHRRAGDDARFAALVRAAHRRGQASRRFDVYCGRAPSLQRELQVLAGCLLHSIRHRCPQGIVEAAHSAGRLRAARGADGRRGAPRPATAAAPSPDDARAQRPGLYEGSDAPDGGDPDFLSGSSGTVSALRRPRARVADALLDLEAGRRVRRCDRAARERPAPQRLLVLGIERPGRRMPAARLELHRTRHRITMRTVALAPAADGDRRPPAVGAAPAGGTGAPRRGGKFEHLNALLAAHPPAGYDWLVVVDDDVVLPRGFLDRFLYCVATAGLAIAQPAHRRHSHAAWPVTHRRPGGSVRATHFVEIGPLTAFAATTFDDLLPFPDLAMGWGLDAYWSALARERGWRTGIVDATPILHTNPVGGGYERAAAVAEGRAFLAARPYVTRSEARWSQRVC